MNGAGMMMERQNLIKKNEQEIKNSRHANFSGQQKSGKPDSQALRKGAAKKPAPAARTRKPEGNTIHRTAGKEKPRYGYNTKRLHRVWQRRLARSPQK